MQSSWLAPKENASNCFHGRCFLLSSVLLRATVFAAQQKNGSITPDRIHAKQQRILIVFSSHHQNAYQKEDFQLFKKKKTTAEENDVHTLSTSALLLTPKDVHLSSKLSMVVANDRLLKLKQRSISKIYVPGPLLTEPLPFFISTSQVVSIPLGPSFTSNTLMAPTFLTSSSPSCRVMKANEFQQISKQPL